MNLVESLLMWTFIFVVSNQKLFLLGLVLFPPGCAPRGPRVLHRGVRGPDLQVRARGLQLHGGGRGQGAVQRRKQRQGGHPGGRRQGGQQGLGGGLQQPPAPGRGGSTPSSLSQYGPTLYTQDKVCTMMDENVFKQNNMLFQNNLPNFPPDMWENVIILSQPFTLMACQWIWTSLTHNFCCIWLNRVL